MRVMGCIAGLVLIFAALGCAAPAPLPAVERSHRFRFAWLAGCSPTH